MAAPVLATPSPGESPEALWEKAQYARPVVCQPLYCTQTAYYIGNDVVHKLHGWVEDGKVINVTRLTTAPLDRMEYRHAYGAPGTYTINNDCQLQLIVKHYFHDYYVIREVTNPAKGYGCTL